VVMRGHTAEVLSAAYSPRGETIVSGGMDGTVRLWDVLRGDQRFVLTSQGEPVRGVAFSSDRRTLVSAGPAGTVRLWRAAQEETPPAVQEQAPAPDEPPPEPEG
jgi:WD40 repeat protein